MRNEHSSVDHETVIKKPEVDFDPNSSLYTITVKLPEAKANTLRETPDFDTVFTVVERGNSMYLVEEASSPSTAKAMLLSMKNL